MNNKSILLTILSTLVLINLSCAQPSPSTVPKFSHDRAAVIAATNVPYRIIRNADPLGIILRDNMWIINFYLSGNTTVSKSELNWPQDPNTTYQDSVHLPPDTYHLLTFSVDSSTGEITSRSASDSVILGGPGSFYIEPKPVTQETWFLILTAIAGVVVGGITVWLFIHRKRNAR